MTYLISLAEWESKFFGFPLGNVDLPADYDPEMFYETLREGRERFRLLCVYLKKFGPETLEAPDANCSRMVEQTTLKKTVSSSTPSLSENVRPYTSNICSKQLERLAILSGALSRFNRDPELSTQYERLFLTWINNSVSGDLSDSIWTWHEAGKPVGLATIRCAKRVHPESGQMEKEGRIGMLSVVPEFRKKGIATSLLLTCENWCNTLDIPVASIVTQRENAPVISLCKNLGFEAKSEESIYHYWSPGWIYDARHGWRHHSFQ